MDKEIIEALLEAQIVMCRASNLMCTCDDGEMYKHGNELWRAALMIEDWLMNQ